ncbi:hypothetical protein D3C73_669830 [compost metagenome]
MCVIAVTDNKQATCINITRHRIDFHCSNNIFVQRLIKTLSSSKYMTFHNFYYIAKGELVRNIPRFFLYTNCTNPFLGDDNPQILRFFNSTISSSFADSQAFSQLAHRYFCPDLKTLDVLK